MISNKFRIWRCQISLGSVSICLLVFDAFLLLCERLRWFAFGAQKGWPVLIALTALVAATLFMSIWFIAAILFRRRFQFTLGSLLLFVVAVAVPCSWLATETRAAEKHRMALQCRRVQRYYDLVPCDRSELSFSNREVGLTSAEWKPVAFLRPPAWLVRLLGVDFFADVVFVHFADTELRVEDLKRYADLRNLEALSLSGSDAKGEGLAQLRVLPRLRQLYLEYSGVNNAGLQEVAELTTLETLNLERTAVGDTGLEMLRGLTALRELRLSGTRVSDAGLRYLSPLQNLRVLDLSATQVTSDGLKFLAGLDNLEDLDLFGTGVDDAGLEYFHGMRSLRRLDLKGLDIEHEESINKLRKALPNCVIDL